MFIANSKMQRLRNYIICCRVWRNDQRAKRPSTSNGKNAMRLQNQVTPTQNVASFTFSKVQIIIFLCLISYFVVDNFGFATLYVDKSIKSCNNRIIRSSVGFSLCFCLKVIRLNFSCTHFVVTWLLWTKQPAQVSDHHTSPVRFFRIWCRQWKSGGLDEKLNWGF